MKRLLLIAVLGSACAPDLRTDYPFDGDLPAGDYVTFTDLGGGVQELRVNAGEPQSWVFVDLDDQRQVPGAEAIGAAGWDVAFQRFRIISNGGVSGVGPVEVAALPGQDFTALTAAPPTGYVQDAADGPDSNQDVDSAFLVDDGWYLYDLFNHGVNPRDIVYVVHGDRAFWAMQILGYYDEAGTSARFRIDVKALTPP
ncbi:MAG TPA: HmuY family protein [Myxococcaceae bacterium]|nr:HmuY family protein [Myxococcaceae bacterium]